MTENPTADDPTSFTIDDAIKAVDFEIDRIGKETQRPGWNDWAIYGGIALVIGSLITIPGNGNVSLENVAKIFFSLEILFAVLAGLQ